MTKIIPKFDKNTPKLHTGFEYGLNVKNTDCITFDENGLRFSLMGGVNIKQLDRMRVTLKVARNPLLSALHSYRHTLDLYNDSQCERYIRRASELLDVGTNVVNPAFYTLIDSLEKYRLDKKLALAEMRNHKPKEMTAKEKKEAIQYLKNPNLLSVISEELVNIGLVGEKTNGLLLYLIYLTRFFDSPLHALIHGSSGSGKTNLLKTVIKTVPEESKHLTTCLTENVLFYPPYRDFWKHKILLLEDLDGSAKALLPLREFMSNQEITKFVTEMDVNTGEHKQKKLTATGPICIVGATTKEQVYEDNSNRSFVLQINESGNHQKKVLEYQNKKAAGLIDTREQQKILTIFQNTQRLLQPIKVVNPFQPELGLPACVFKKLRTNQHYISLIKAITFLYQHQLKIQKDDYGKPFIETNLEHIELANNLFKDNLLRKSDELNGSQRSFFERLKIQLKKENKTSFFAKEIRQNMRLHPMTLKRQLDTLCKYGFVCQVSDNKKKGYEYEILAWEEYTFLQNEMTILDEKLTELKAKYLV